jgi:lipid-binding SYLF domain-containing protein
MKVQILLMTLAILLSGNTLWAEENQAAEQAERARQAASVLQEILAVPDQQIPRDLLQRAHGLAVIPHVVKGAFIVGGRYGKGLLTRRNSDGTWTAPSYVNLGGASAGFQIGVSATDLILVFTEENGVKALLDGRLKLGADVSVAAGPVGRSGEIGTDVQLKSAIYSYSRSKGLFAGIALDGAVLSIDNSANRAAYGASLSGEDILFGGRATVNATVAPFIKAVENQLPKVAETKPIL